FLFPPQCSGGARGVEECCTILEKWYYTATIARSPALCCGSLKTRPGESEVLGFWWVSPINVKGFQIKNPVPHEKPGF
ncbi:hypothetical protein QUB05_08420, partial [Microcoleus sp. F10-C6]|uniref:hypothetical protein n=1 Tax=unclassified Microcoleus TaxID=2642155 RepID=UPI002FD240AE